MPRKTITIEAKVEIDVYYEVNEAEPDVGILHPGVDDFQVIGEPRLLDPWRDVVLEELNGSIPDLEDNYCEEEHDDEE